jgi:adenylate cyclase
MDATPAAVFTDLCDYTRVTERLGDRAAARIAVTLRDIALDVARRHGGRVVKMLGDGAHLHFADAARAVPAALELVARIQAAGLPCARAGVNAGPMIEAEGDYYGLAVNIAARIAAQAAPGEVLLGADALRPGQRPSVRFERVGPVALRGVTNAVTLYRARTAWPRCDVIDPPRQVADRTIGA